MKHKIIVWAVEWMCKKYPVVVMLYFKKRGEHIHCNPKRKLTAVVNFPKEGADGNQPA